MNLSALLQAAMAPTHDTGRRMAQDVMVGAVALGFGMTGGGFLIAAGFWVLVPEVGHPAAAAIMGAILIGLAAVVILVAQIRRQSRQQRMRELAAAEAAARDPLPSLVFDLAYMAGRQFLAGRR